MGRNSTLRRALVIDECAAAVRSLKAKEDPDAWGPRDKALDDAARHLESLK